MGAACVVVLDSLGNIPFMRFVRPSERNQMSPVFHSVRTTAPGVPLVPNPPGPFFHAESSNSGLNQPAAGLSMVYRHSRPFS